MNRGNHLLHAAFRTGAVLDAAMLLPMLFPSIGGAMFGIPDFQPGTGYIYAMYVGASLMAGWTVLLLWADRKPAERREVLLMTLLPVIVGMIGASVYAAASGLIEVARLLPMLGLQILLAVFFLAAYLHPQPPEADG